VLVIGQLNEKIMLKKVFAMVKYNKFFEKSFEFHHNYKSICQKVVLLSHKNKTHS